MNQLDFISSTIIVDDTLLSLNVQNDVEKKVVTLRRGHREKMERNLLLWNRGAQESAVGAGSS